MKRLLLAGACLAAVLWSAADANASVTVQVNGSNYTIPQTNEKGWGTNVTTWIQAVSANTLQPNGGSFTLTADTDFGASFGLKAPYYKSKAANLSTSGVFRAGNNEFLGFRNAANSNNLLLGVNASDQLTYNGVVLAGSSGPTFSDSTFTVFNNSDNTKKVALDVSGVTTATTRTIIVPNANTTLVGTDNTATLTNKTINASSNTLTNVSLTTAVTGQLPTGNGGTGVASVTTTPTASAFAGWDANSNISANNLLSGYATTTTAAGTTTLAVGSARRQYFTGSSTQTVTLPAVSTLALGTQFEIDNLSSGNVTVQSSGANALQAMTQNTVLVVTSIATSGTGTAAWNWSYGSVQGGLPGTSAVLTGLSASYGTIAGTDTILQGFNKTAAGMLAESSNDEYKNISFVTSVSSNNLTISLREATGSSNPSAANPGLIRLQNPAGILNNATVERQVTAATSITANSGATFGCSNGVECYLYVYVTDNGGTINLCLSGSANFDEGQLYTSTTISSGATSATTLYCSTGVASRPVRLIGRIRLTEATAGVYASAATETYNGTASTFISKSLYTAKGSLLSASSSMVPSALPVGSDSQILTADSSQTTGLRWASATQGNKNYIQYANFENNATTGWSLGTVTLTSSLPTGTPTFGSGASGNLSIAITSSNQLAGTYSLSEVSSAASTAGDLLASNAFTIDSADQAKVLTFKFYYKAQANPTNGNWTGTSSNSFGVAIYNVTQGGSNWIIPAGVWCETQSSGIGYCTGTFQTTASDTQYRLAIYNANASAGAITMYYDDFFVGPQTAPIGPVITDAQSYTATWSAGFGTVTNSQTWWERHGDKMRIWGSATGGTSAASVATVTLPSGYSVDTNKVPSTANANSVVGWFTVGGTTANAIKQGHLLVAGSGTVLQFAVAEYVTTTSGFSNSTGTVVDPGSNNISFWAEVPITGWSSNTQMSSDTDTRVVALYVTGNAGQALTANVTNIPFATVVQDTHGAWNGSVYTVPVTGFYQINGMVAETTSATQSFDLYKNGSVAERVMASQASAATFNLNGFVYCNAGDTLAVRSNASQTLSNSASQHYLAINRVSGPSVVAATESVNARYHNTATSISGSLATISWTTSDFDTHAGMSAGTYTVPVSGKYQVSTCIAFSAASAAAGNAVDVQLQKNGAAFGEEAPVYQSTQVGLPVCLADLVNANAGDTIRVQASSAATTPAITSSNTKNFFSIERVGN